jgi:cytochrome b561
MPDSRRSGPGFTGSVIRRNALTKPAQGLSGHERSHSSLQKGSHWGLALLCLVEFPTAEAIQRGHLGHTFGIRPSTIDSLLATTHEWTGWLILVLVTLLLASRVLEGAPRLPDGMKPWQRLLAYAAHAAIYLGLFALVASGAAAMYFSGRLAFIHIVLSQIGVALIALHVVAALWHQLVRRDDLLERLMPARRRDRREFVSPMAAEGHRR